MKTINRVIIWIKTIMYYLLSIKSNRKSTIMTIEETINYIKRTRRSVIRLGDGEFNILNGKSIHYQNHSPKLSDQLQQIINEYIENYPNIDYLLCMPKEYLTPNGFRFILNRKLISSWAYSRFVFKKKYDLDIEYGNSFIFGRGNELIYSNIWNSPDVTRVIFVHNSKSYGEIFNERYNIETKTIVIPEKNAFDSIEKTYLSIKENIDDFDKTLVLISAGPSAKVLTWKLSKDGIWAIDTGHCWDDPLIIK